ncbi:hypothetical protein T08_10686 [Trichinella sp. T8]|nr:hypothetical protein T08_10686 [Trichinella sp. T8]
MAATMTRFLRPTCLSLPTPSLTHQPYFLLPHCLSQSIDAENVALSCFLRFPDS